MRIGFIGLGMMGRGMAANLQKAGHELVVHDLTRQAASQHLANGATWAASPRAVAEACDIVFTSLPTPADVEAVGLGENGLASGFRKGAAWFDLSTNAVDVVRRLHATLAEQGVDFLDAPVSGGPSGASSGRLAIWVGGDKPAFEKYQAALDAMGDQARYIGAIGAGTIAKLTHNCAGAAINTVLAEVFTMGVKAGVEPLALWEAIRQGATGRQRTFDLAAWPRGQRTDAVVQHGAARDDRGDEPWLGRAGQPVLHVVATGARRDCAAGGAGGPDQGRGGQGLTRPHRADGEHVEHRAATTRRCYRLARGGDAASPKGELT